MNTLSYLRYFIFIIGLIAIDVQAETKLQGIAETAYYECEDLGVDALAIQSIRYEQNSSIQEIIDTLRAELARLGFTVYMRFTNSPCTGIAVA